jgi:hypothetical protein
MATPSTQELLGFGQGRVTSKTRDINGGVGGIFYQRVGELFSSNMIIPSTGSSQVLTSETSVI